MSILTEADLLITRDGVDDRDQRIILNELRRFLTHESAGVTGFDRMPSEWVALNRHISAGGKVLASSTEAHAVVEAWHQETRDLSLILSRQTETPVAERLPKAQRSDAAFRQKQELTTLRETMRLQAAFDIENAAAPLEVIADIPRRTVEVGMTLRAPEDRVSSKARVNWLLRQIKTEITDGLFIRLLWPGRSEDTQFELEALREDAAICEGGKAGLQVHSFHIYRAKRLGARFTQQANFITDIEDAVPAFYREIGQGLSIWQKPAAKIKEDRSQAHEVGVAGIAEDAEDDASQ